MSLARALGSPEPLVVLSHRTLPPAAGLLCPPGYVSHSSAKFGFLSGSLNTHPKPF